MKQPNLIFKHLKNQPNIGNANKKGEGMAGRIMLWPDIDYGDYKFDFEHDNEWMIIDGESGAIIAEGTLALQKIHQFKKWINNIKVWLESHFEIWIKDYENCKLGFLIQDLSKPIHLIFQVKVYFEGGLWQIWQKEFKGLVKLDEVNHRGLINQSNTKLVKSNFDENNIEPENCKEMKEKLKKANKRIKELEKIITDKIQPEPVTLQEAFDMLLFQIWAWIKNKKWYFILGSIISVLILILGIIIF